MTRFGHTANVSEPSGLCAVTGLPVLLTDTRIHRRILVHFLYFPGLHEPRIHRAIPAALNDCLSRGFAEVCIVASEAPRGLSYYRTTIQPQPKVAPHG